MKQKKCHWNTESIVSTIEQFIKEKKRIPVAREMNAQNRLPSRKTFETIMGITWGKYTKLHYPELVELSEIRHQQRVLDIRRERSEWTKERLIHAVRQFVEQNGRLPIIQEYTLENNLPSYTTFCKIAEQTMVAYLKKYFTQNYLLKNEDIEKQRNTSIDREKRVMGCWGITAFESDAGLDSVDYIRSNLPQDGKLELEKIIDALQKDNVRLPDVRYAESHTSPMALAEIVERFLSRDIGDLDYDEDWAAKDKKFADIISFSASKESIRWLREYLSDTLKYIRKNAEFKAECGTKWNGWFEEKNWIRWQEHMENLINQLDTLLAYPEECLELVSSQKPEQGLKMECNDNSPNADMDGPILGM